MVLAIFRIVISLWLFVYLCKSDQTLQSESFNKQCTHVNEKYQLIVSKYPGHNEHDVQENICHSSQSCCTREMEMAFQKQAVHDVHTLLKKSGAYSKSTLSSHVQFYNDHYTNLLQLARNKTRQEINSVINFPNHGWLEPLSRLFSDLIDALENNVDIAGSVNRFFMEIFPDTFHMSTDGVNAMQFTSEYGDCLKRELYAIRPKPFDDKMQKMSKTLNTALASIRSFLRAFRLGIDVIDSVERFTLSKNCSRALVRMTHCSECATYSEVKPCAGFCLNVMRGCLVEVHGLDHFYSEFIGALHRTTLNVHRRMSLEGELHLLPAQVSDTILHAIETSSLYYTQVVERCGEPPAKPSRRHGQRGKHVSGGGRRKSETQVTLASSAAMAERLGAVERTLVSMKSLTADLGDSVCNSDLAADLRHSCWNGTAVSPYLLAVPSNTASEQLLRNPEVAPSSSLQSPEIVSLKQKLSHMIKELNLIADKSRSRRTLNDAPSDDEDDGSASGTDDTSGSGVQEEPIVQVTAPTDGAAPRTTADIVFHTSKKPIVHHPESGGGGLHATRPTPPLVDRAGGASTGIPLRLPALLAVAFVAFAVGLRRM